MPVAVVAAAAPISWPRAAPTGVCVCVHCIFVQYVNMIGSRPYDARLTNGRRQGECAQKNERPSPARGVGKGRLVFVCALICVCVCTAEASGGAGVVRLLERSCSYVGEQ